MWNCVFFYLIIICKHLFFFFIPSFPLQFGYFLRIFSFMPSFPLPFGYFLHFFLFMPSKSAHCGYIKLIFLFLPSHHLRFRVFSWFLFLYTLAQSKLWVFLSIFSAYTLTASNFWVCFNNFFSYTPAPPKTSFSLVILCIFIIPKKKMESGNRNPLLGDWKVTRVVQGDYKSCRRKQYLGSEIGRCISITSDSISDSRTLEEAKQDP